MTVVDTTVWIDYFGGVSNLQTNWLQLQLDRQRIAITDLILCEVLQGIRSDAAFRNVQREISRFEIFETGGASLATAAARNYRSLRARGLTIRKTIDCLIATFCIRNGHALLHSDRDYDAFERYLGLQVIHPGN